MFKVQIVYSNCINVHLLVIIVHTLIILVILFRCAFLSIYNKMKIFSHWIIYSICILKEIPKNYKYIICILSNAPIIVLEHLLLLKFSTTTHNHSLLLHHRQTPTKSLHLLFTSSSMRAEKKYVYLFWQAWQLYKRKHKLFNR